MIKSAELVTSSLPGNAKERHVYAQASDDSVAVFFEWQFWKVLIENELMMFKNLRKRRRIKPYSTNLE